MTANLLIGCGGFNALIVHRVPEYNMVPRLADNSALYFELAGDLCSDRRLSAINDKRIAWLRKVKIELHEDCNPI